MTDWKPIETAPKDGAWLLLFGRHSRHAVNAMIVCRWCGDCWESSDDGYGAYILPTHWMPLPPPPKKEEKWEFIPVAKEQPNNTTSTISTRDLDWLTLPTDKEAK